MPVPDYQNEKCELQEKKKKKKTKRKIESINEGIFER